jgi:hypothetical protein
MNIYIRVVYSPDDNSYYADVIAYQSGKTLHTTAMRSDSQEAKTLALIWVSEHPQPQPTTDNNRELEP